MCCNARVTFLFSENTISLLKFVAFSLRKTRAGIFINGASVNQIGHHIIINLRLIKIFYDIFERSEKIFEKSENIFVQ